MRMSSNHQIKQTVLDFQFNGSADGFAFQHELRDWFDGFLQELSASLDEATGEQTIISVDKLELEIELSANDWKQQASQKIKSQLKEKLLLMQKDQIDSSGYREHSSNQQFAANFLFYLQYGYLKWNAATLHADEWKEQIEELFLDADEVFAHSLREVLVRSASSRERLMQLIPYQSTVEIFRWLYEQRSAIHTALLHDLQLLMKAAIVHNYHYMRHVVYKAFLMNLSDTTDPVQIKQELAQSIHKKALIDPSVIDVVSELQFQSKRLLALQTELTAEKKSTRFKHEAKKYRLQKLMQEEQEWLAQQEQLQQPLDEPVFISNAGLVIVAAFLPAFLERMKFAADQKILDPQKAVCVIQYLATGSDKMQEYELVVPKILCGLPLTAAVHPGNFHMNKSQRKEAEQVLLSIIEHWSILQSTSIDGLRQSFLQRNGKLSYNGSDWLLQVEQQPYDMLLQHLPWNISMIKLPWMGQLLKTEWIS
jgi:hypothetical protein